MTSPSRIGACSALITAATLTGLLTGCTGASGGAALTAAHVRDHGPVAGSHELAASSAQRLLGSLVLPAGWQRLPARPVPLGLEQPGVWTGGPGNFLDQDRLYRLSMTVPRAIAFLRAHEPRGTVMSPTSGASTEDGVTDTAMVFAKRRVPPGINQISLIETLTPGADGSSLLRADAQVVWYPPRSAPEHLIARQFRSVRITLTWSGGTERVQGGQGLIRPLAELLDSMHATPHLVLPCPMPRLFYKLVFAPALRAQRVIIVTSEDCGEDQVSVGGRLQPELNDSGTLSTLVTRLVRHYVHAHVSR